VVEVVDVVIEVVVAVELVDLHIATVPISLGTPAIATF
jgi:hypothetical protein